ncbi:uncharacterized protein LOC143809258 [Ranitomeya variabilis]|uniref:uncharacterized protein LOC143809258 n=1 Tax=Ranitomeya variabilis TaxID=490064 RepID=UPI004057956A
MLFRFLLIVSVLLAYVEGAPINIRCHDSWPKHMAPVNIRRHDSWPKHTIPAGNTNHLIFGPCSKTCGICTRVVYSTRGCQNGQDKCFLRTEQCKGPEDCGLDGIVPTKIPWNEYIIYIAVSISILLLGLFIGVMCSIICRHLKKDKSRRNDESRCSTDEDRETSPKPLGKHEDGPMVKKRDVLENANISTPAPDDVVINIETDKDVAISSDTGKHEDGPMVKKRDVLENADISTPAPADIVINIETDKDVAISSDRKHEEQTEIVTDVAPHGPMVENRDILNSTMIPDAGDAVINMGPDEDVVTARHRKHENNLNIGNHEAPRGPLAEKSDYLKDFQLFRIRFKDAITELKAYQNAMVKSDRKHENNLNIGNHEAPRGPLAEKSDYLKDFQLFRIQFNDVITENKAYQNTMVKSDRKHENNLNIGNHEAPRGPLAEKSDYLKDFQLFRIQFNDVITELKAYQNAMVKSDRKHENNLNIGNHEAPRGPLAEKSDYIKDFQLFRIQFNDVITENKAYQNTMVKSDRKHENNLNIGNHEAPRGPLAEKSDYLKDFQLFRIQFNDVITELKAYQNTMVKSDRKHENNLNIGNHEAPRGPLAEKSDYLKDFQLFRIQFNDVITELKAYQNTMVKSDSEAEQGLAVNPMNMGSSWRQLYISIKRQIPCSVSVLYHWI